MPPWPNGNVRFNSNSQHIPPHQQRLRPPLRQKYSQTSLRQPIQLRAHNRPPINRAKFGKPPQRGNFTPLRRPVTNQHRNTETFRFERESFTNRGRGRGYNRFDRKSLNGNERIYHFRKDNFYEERHREYENQHRNTGYHQRGSVHKHHLNDPKTSNLIPNDFFSNRRPEIYKKEIDYSPVIKVRTRNSSINVENNEKRETAHDYFQDSANTCISHCESLKDSCGAQNNLNDGDQNQIGEIDEDQRQINQSDSEQNIQNDKNREHVYPNGGDQEQNNQDDEVQKESNQGEKTTVVKVNNDKNIDSIYKPEKLENMSQTKTLSINPEKDKQGVIFQEITPTSTTIREKSADSELSVPHDFLVTNSTRDKTLPRNSLNPSTECTAKHCFVEKDNGEVTGASTRHDASESRGSIDQKTNNKMETLNLTSSITKQVEDLRKSKVRGLMHMLGKSSLLLRSKGHYNHIKKYKTILPSENRKKTDSTSCNRTPNVATTEMVNPRNLKRSHGNEHSRERSFEKKQRKHLAENNKPRKYYARRTPQRSVKVRKTSTEPHESGKIFLHNEGTDRESKHSDISNSTHVKEQDGNGTAHPFSKHEKGPCNRQANADQYQHESDFSGRRTEVNNRKRTCIINADNDKEEFYAKENELSTVIASNACKETEGHDLVCKAKDNEHGNILVQAKNKEYEQYSSLNGAHIDNIETIDPLKEYNRSNTPRLPRQKRKTQSSVTETSYLKQKLPDKTNLLIKTNEQDLYIQKDSLAVASESHSSDANVPFSRTKGSLDMDTTKNEIHEKKFCSKAIEKIVKLTDKAIDLGDDAWYSNENRNLVGETTKAKYTTESIADKLKELRNETRDPSIKSKTFYNEKSVLYETTKNIGDKSEELRNESIDLPCRAKDSPNERRVLNEITKNIVEESKELRNETIDLPCRAKESPNETRVLNEITKNIVEESKELRNETIDLPCRAKESPNETRVLNEITKNIVKESKELRNETIELPCKAKDRHNESRVIHQTTENIKDNSKDLRSETIDLLCKAQDFYNEAWKLKHATKNIADKLRKLQNETGYVSPKPKDSHIETKRPNHATGNIEYEGKFLRNKATNFLCKAKYFNNRTGEVYYATKKFADISKEIQSDTKDLSSTTMDFYNGTRELHYSTKNIEDERKKLHSETADVEFKVEEFKEKTKVSNNSTKDIENKIKKLENEKTDLLYKAKVFYYNTRSRNLDDKSRVIQNRVTDLPCRAKYSRDKSSIENDTEQHISDKPKESWDEATSLLREAECLHNEAISLNHTPEEIEDKLEELESKATDIPCKDKNFSNEAINYELKDTTGGLNNGAGSPNQTAKHIDKSTILRTKMTNFSCNIKEFNNDTIVLNSRTKNIEVEPKGIRHEGTYLQCKAATLNIGDKLKDLRTETKFLSRRAKDFCTGAEELGCANKDIEDGLNEIQNKTDLDCISGCETEDFKIKTADLKLKTANVNDKSSDKVNETNFLVTDVDNKNAKTSQQNDSLVENNLVSTEVSSSCKEGSCSQGKSIILKTFKNDVSNIATAVKLLIRKRPELDEVLTGACKEILTEMSEAVQKKVANYDASNISTI
ncbi:myosin heavy chain, non-muscle-like [Hydractinia symbiolongicarpus]|uniref:myosin heavy chain, non-muscle-like n=1 Tax=Hydractinia symbiolongicarpus TaxID=13093 RepID=UPI00255136F5|nr:myosin heavy chain, non-muscle-like [Hydractinia symbiolongicarpus]XP_057296541.1 myosin heavy chain, non-muscle-like [Hydractinia symbiolongicarpus]